MGKTKGLDIISFNLAPEVSLSSFSPSEYVLMTCVRLYCVSADGLIYNRLLPCCDIFSF